MKLNILSHQTSESRALLKSFCGIAAAVLLLGGLTAACRADILYVGNTGNDTIEKFTSGGVGSVFASSGLIGPEFLAFTDDAGQPLRLPVPEPSTWVMLTIGAIGLLGIKRRKSGRTKA